MTATNLTVAKAVFKYLVNYRGKRSEHARWLFFLLSRHFTPVVASDVSPALMFVPTRDLTIGWEVFLRGTFEDVYMQRAFDLLDAHGLGGVRERAFIDVGANIGTACITAVTRYGCSRAVAFEPDPVNFTLLRQNLVANGLEERIRAYQFGLSAAEREASLSIDAASRGNNRILDGASAAGETVPVTTRTFDSLVESGELPAEEVGLVWMDIQGHEGHMLQGAKSMLASAAPVVMEYCPGALAEAGTLAWVKATIAATYTHVVDLRAGASLAPAAEIHALTERYPGTTYTDLLLLKL